VTHFGREDFNRHAVAQQRVARTKDGPHTALCQEGLYLVLTV
jgi:hypothetical protein